MYFHSSLNHSFWSFISHLLTYISTQFSNHYTSFVNHSFLYLITFMLLHSSMPTQLAINQTILESPYLASLLRMGCTDTDICWIITSYRQLSLIPNIFSLFIKVYANDYSKYFVTSSWVTNPGVSRKTSWVEPILWMARAQSSVVWTFDDTLHTCQR